MRHHRIWALLVLATSVLGRWARAPGNILARVARRRPAALRPVIIAVSLLFTAVTAGAQTTSTVLALPMAWGPVEVEHFIDTDGDPATVEVLIWRHTDFKWRIVAVRSDGSLCAGRWFWFAYDQFAWPRITRVGAVDVAFLTESTYGPQARSYYFQVALEHPAECLP